MALYEFFTSRNNGANVATFVGQAGRLFYDGTNGVIKLSDGTTPGGTFIPYNIASNVTIGGIKAGPGANVALDGTLTIDTSGLPLSIGNLEILDTTIKTLQVNRDLYIVSNGTGNVNLIGEVHFYKPNGFPPTGEPFFRAKSDGQLRILVPVEDPLEGGIEIIGSAAGTYITPGQPGAMLHMTGNPGTAARVYLDGNAEYAAFVARRFNGNVAAPTQVLAGQDVFRINGTAATSSGMGNVALAQMRMTALEDQTPTAQGSSITFTVTPIGSSAASRVDVANVTVAEGITTTKAKILGNLTVLGNIIGNATTTTATIGTANISTLIVSGNTQSTGANIGYITMYQNAIYSQLTTSDITIGQLAATANVVINRVTTHNRNVHIDTGNLFIGTGGTVYTPRVVYTSTGVRAIQAGIYANLQFGVDSIVHHYNPVGDVFVNFNSLVAGAQITLIISMDTRRTINYGVAAARNSTTGAISIASTSLVNNQCVQLVYTCIDGTAANTYVSVSRV